MRVKNLASAFAAIAVLASATIAPADDTHDTALTPRTVSVNVKAGWHANKEYPWKLVDGDRKLDKTHFVLTETTASIVDAP